MSRRRRDLLPLMGLLALASCGEGDAPAQIPRTLMTDAAPTIAPEAPDSRHLGALLESCRDECTMAFQQRSWAFCHFLWNYDSGKYRERFLGLLGDALAGTASSAKFARDMNRPDASDWGDVEMEFEWYWTELVNRRVGRDGATREPLTPSTDAPTGRAEDDPEFCAIWRADRKRSVEKR